MTYVSFKGNGSLTREDRWPAEGTQAVLCLSGTVRVHSPLGSAVLDACTGIVLVGVDTVDFVDSKGIVLPLSSEAPVVDDTFVLDPLAAHVGLDVFFDNRKNEAHRLAAADFLLNHLELVGSDVPPSAVDAGSPVDRAIAHMQAHLDEPLTLQGLADALHCGPQTLIRQFQAARNQSPMQALAEMRLDKAKAMLAETETTITQIAHAVGYSTISGFSHFFKKHSGFSPKEFRDNVKWLL